MTRLETTILATLTALALAPSVALAERVPDQGPQDVRIRTVTYNPRDVVRLLGHYGYHTLIEFAESEKVETVLIGDSVAWQVIPTKRGNTLAVKPAEMNAATNLTVITDRRTYAFFLEAREGEPGSEMTWRVLFRYPDDEAAARFAALEQTRVESASLVTPDVAANRSDFNFNYTYAGSKKLAPEVLFDDGEFTYFRFKAGTELPAIFLVDDDKKESLLNHQVVGEYVKVHRVGGQFSLRLGTRLACVFNEERTPAKAESVNRPVARRSSAAEESVQ